MVEYNTPSKSYFLTNQGGRICPQFVHAVPNAVIVSTEVVVRRVTCRSRLLGSGQRVTPSDLKLGGCAADDDGGETVLFRSELPDCGSTTMVCVCVCVILHLHLADAFNQSH